MCSKSLEKTSDFQGYEDVVITDVDQRTLCHRGRKSASVKRSLLHCSVAGSWPDRILLVARVRGSSRDPWLSSADLNRRYYHCPSGYCARRSRNLRPAPLRTPGAKHYNVTQHGQSVTSFGECVCCEDLGGTIYPTLQRCCAILYPFYE